MSRIFGEQKKGPAGIWTRIVGFKVQSANRYTTGPHKWSCGVSIPVPDACKAPTLPIELQPRMWFLKPLVGVEPTTLTLQGWCNNHYATVAFLIGHVSKMEVCKIWNAKSDENFFFVTWLDLDLTWRWIGLGWVGVEFSEISTKKNKMRRPGIEPGPSAWKAEIITIRLSTLDYLHHPGVEPGPQRWQRRILPLN